MEVHAIEACKCHPGMHAEKNEQRARGSQQVERDSKGDTMATIRWTETVKETLEEVTEAIGEHWQEVLYGQPKRQQEPNRRGLRQQNS